MNQQSAASHGQHDEITNASHPYRVMVKHLNIKRFEDIVAAESYAERLRGITTDPVTIELFTGQIWVRASERY